MNQLICILIVHSKRMINVLCRHSHRALQGTDAHDCARSNAADDNADFMTSVKRIGGFVMQEEWQCV